MHVRYTQKCAKPLFALMFCAAIRESDRSHLFYMSRFAENVNVSFEVLKEGSDKS